MRRDKKEKKLARLFVTRRVSETFFKSNYVLFCFSRYLAKSNARHILEMNGL